MQIHKEEELHCKKLAHTYRLINPVLLCGPTVRANDVVSVSQNSTDPNRGCPVVWINSKMISLDNSPLLQTAFCRSGFQLIGPPIVMGGVNLLYSNAHNLVAQWWRIYLQIQESQDPLGQEDPLEETWQPHPNILAWRILWKEELGGPQSIELQKIWYNWSHLACLVEKCLSHSDVPSINWYINWIAIIFNLHFYLLYLFSCVARYDHCCYILLLFYTIIIVPEIQMKNFLWGICSSAYFV